MPYMTYDEYCDGVRDGSIVAKPLLDPTAPENAHDWVTVTGHQVFIKWWRSERDVPDYDDAA